MHKLYIFFILLGLSACSKQSIKPIAIIEDEPIEISQEHLVLQDLKNIPQESSYYSHVVSTQKASLESFLERYFSIWSYNIFPINIDDAMWAYKTFEYGNSYGENLQLLEEEFFNTALLNSNFDAYATLNQRAVTLKLVNLRAFPTVKPLFKDPSKAGEGFPFDYMQNSTVAANKPLLISHYSEDKEWAFVASSFAFGWVKADEIAYITQNYSELWKNAQQIFVTKEGVPLYNQDGSFLYSSRIGMVLPLIKENEASYTVLTITRDKKGRAYYSHTEILKEYANKGLLEFKPSTVDTILNQLKESHYGWGGLYGERDCSSTIRDFFIPFGVWLPRNSSMQSKEGDMVSLENLSEEEKIALIRQRAIPFRTLLYKPGHIVLYVGENSNQEPIVFQNVWGVKTHKKEKEGRFIVGKSIFSTLKLGEELESYDKESSFLSQLKSFNTLKIQSN